MTEIQIDTNADELFRKLGQANFAFSKSQEQVRALMEQIERKDAIIRQLRAELDSFRNGEPPPDGIKVDG